MGTCPLHEGKNPRRDISCQYRQDVNTTEPQGDHLKFDKGWCRWKMDIEWGGQLIVFNHGAITVFHGFTKGPLKHVMIWYYRPVRPLNSLKLLFISECWLFHQTVQQPKQNKETKERARSEHLTWPLLLAVPVISNKKWQGSCTHQVQPMFTVWSSSNTPMQRYLP